MYSIDVVVFRFGEQKNLCRKRMDFFPSFVVPLSLPACGEEGCSKGAFNLILRGI